MIQLIKSVFNLNFKIMLVDFLKNEVNLLITWASSVAMLAIRSVNPKIMEFLDVNHLHFRVFPLIIDMLTIISLTVATSYTIHKWVSAIKGALKKDNTK